MSKTSYSPLRYPGGKTNLVKYILNLIKLNNLAGCHFYEPYAGGASVSIGLLENKIINKAFLVEKDPLIYAFWRSVFDYTDELINLINETNIDINTWKNMIEYRKVSIGQAINYSVVELGFAGLFLNRTNYDGIIQSGPIGGINQNGSKYKINYRFNKDKIINQIIKISRYKDNVQVFNDDAINFMKYRIKWKANKKIFVYIDPPYVMQGKNLYRYYYDEKDHTDLAMYIKKKAFPWLISYDDNIFINKLYLDTNDNLCKQHLYADYSAGNSKKGKELLISNLVIPPVSEEYSSSENIM